MIAGFRSDFELTGSPSEVALRVVLQQGIFEEVGEFGSLEVRNNALSNFLRSDRPGSLQQGIAFMCDASGPSPYDAG